MATISELGHRLGFGPQSRGGSLPEHAASSRPATAREIMEELNSDQDRILTELEKHPGDSNLISALDRNDGALAELHRG